MKREEKRKIKKYPSGVGGKGKFYFFVLKNIFCRFICWLWVSRIRGTKNIPAEGPLVVVVNHQTWIDFMFLTFGFRKIRFLSGFIKDAYFDIPCLNFFLRDLAQIRVDRERKKDSLGEAIKLLKGGHVVVIFPEGTRTKTGGVGNFRRGLGLIAQELPDVPFIPAAIRAGEVWPPGSSMPRIFAGRRVQVAIGKPVKCKDFGGNGEHFSQKVREMIIELK